MFDAKRRAIGVVWIAIAVGLIAFAARTDESWLRAVLGVPIAVALIMGLLHLAPELFAHLLAQIAFARAFINNQQLPNTQQLAKQIRDAIKSRADVDSSVAENAGVAGASAPPPAADEWNSLVRPVLHQASQYTAPTYYLNGNLQVIDWNLGFELIFDRITGELRGKHVNWLIAQLDNSQDVFGHARLFPVRVEQQPQVDTERLLYTTERYGLIEFEKVATKLHDRHGQQQGWVVTLLIRQAGKWVELIRDLAARIEDDKFWSIYSVSYDLVLGRYPEYAKLLQAVAHAIPGDAKRVLDLGAGTGNMTRILLDPAQGRTVWAVEQNIAMLDLLRVKDFVARAGDRLKIVKSSVEHLEMLKSEAPFDAATTVNVLYAVDDVPACLNSLARVIKPGGSFALTTTDEVTKLTPLLDDIRASIGAAADYPNLAPHYNRVRELNLQLEAKRLTTRYTRDQYINWLKAAGFVVDSWERAYKDAVIVIRTHKAGA